MKISKYRELTCWLDVKIADLAKSLCRSNTYGYCVDGETLRKLINIKNLLIDSFNLKEINYTYYSCSTVEDSNINVVKKFNRLVGDKVELIVKTITKTPNNTNVFNFELPEIPHTGGFYIYGLWINCELETEEDITKILAILENMEYLGFYGFTYNVGTNSIESSTSYDYVESFSYEYVYFDVLKTLQCVDCKQVQKLIEDVV